MLHTRKNIYFPLPPILINNIPISFNYTFKLLGIIIEFKLTWKPHIQAVQKKISSACGILFNLRNKINRDVAKTIYIEMNAMCSFNDFVLNFLQNSEFALIFWAEAY